MLQVQVERIEIIVEARVVAMRAVEICAHLQIGAAAELAAPAAEYVAAGGVYFQISRWTGAADDADGGRELTDVCPIQVRLQRQRIGLARVPVCTKTGVTDAPVIGARRAWMERRAAIGVLTEHAEEPGLAELAPGARGRAALFAAHRRAEH